VSPFFLLLPQDTTYLFLLSCSLPRSSVTILIPTSLHVLLANASSHSRRSTRWNERCAPTWSGSSTLIPHLCAIFNIAFSKLSPCPTCLKPPKTTMERWQHKPLLPTFLPTASMLSFEETWHKTNGDELEPVSQSPS